MADGEAILLARYAQRRDADAFRALFEVHQHMVYGACYRLLGNRQDAEDAAQNCFLQLAVKAGRLRAPIAGWLHKVAVGVSIDMLRQKTARSARERKASAAASAERGAEPTWDEIKGSVDEAIAGLPDNLRVPVVMYYLEGRKQEDVAAELGISQPAVSGRLGRGVEALRKHLAKAGYPAAVPSLSALLAHNGPTTAPVTLSAALGKMALAGVGGGTVASAAGAGAIVALLLLILLAAGVLVAAAVSLSRLKAARSEPRPAAPIVSEAAAERAEPAPGAPAPGEVIATRLGAGEGAGMFLNLDTGEVLPMAPDVADVQGMVGWMRAHGADVLYEPSMEGRSLIGVDMIVAPVAASAWDNPDPAAAVAEALPAAAPKAFPVFFRAEGELPATFAFRTREGAAGLLQVVRFHEGAPRTAAIRYKLAAPTARRGGR